jgi:hypothetical protein
MSKSSLRMQRPYLMLAPSLKCHLASFYQCKTIVLMEFDTLKQTAKISQSAGELD